MSAVAAHFCRPIYAWFSQMLLSAYYEAALQEHKE